MRLLQDDALYKMFGEVIPESFWTVPRQTKSSYELQEIGERGPSPDDRVAFRSHHGSFMRAWKDKLYADKRKEVLDKGNTFKPVFKGGNSVALQSSYGKYVVCDDGGVANANRAKASSWETWSVYIQKNCMKDRECISIKNEAKGLWLTAESDGKVSCNRKKVGAWEKWYGWDESKYPQNRKAGGKDGKRKDKEERKDRKRKDKEEKKDGKRGEKGGKGRGKGWNWDSEGSSAIDFTAENFGNMTIEYENDFYSGQIDMPGEDDFVWNYRRSSAAGLVASTMAAANIALFLF